MIKAERKKEMEKLSLKQINDFHKKIKDTAKTIQDWKRIVKEFAIEYNLSDMTAIDIANKRY